MSESRMPEWALTNGHLDGNKISKNLVLYGYAKQDDNGFFIDPKLNEDYPALFNLLVAYQASRVGKEYAKKIDDGKVEAYYDDGVRKYRLEE